MIAKILLAAGEARRLGSPKQLLVRAGQPFIRRMVSLLLESDLAAGPVIVVLGARAELIRPVLEDLPVTIQVNDDWAAGMSSSLRAGLRAVPGEAEAALFCVVDQPEVSLALLRQLIDTYRTRRAGIVASRYADGTLGVPVLFDRSMFAELAELEGPAGAQPLLERHAAELIAVDFPRGHIDVDHPEDL